MSKNHSVVFGSGPLGLNVARLLSGHGQVVTLVNRSGRLPLALPANVSIKRADATDPAAVYHLCKNANTVFHCAMPPYTKWASQFPALTNGILQGAKLARSKLIYADNLYCYGDSAGSVLSEQSPIQPAGRKGKIRAEMSYHLLQAHLKGELPVVIARAADFYGPEVLNAALGEAFFGNAVRKKTSYLLGDLDQAHSFTYIEDYARALVTLAADDSAYGSILHVPSAKAIPLRAIVDMTESLLGFKIRLRTISRHTLSVLSLFSPMMRETREMMFSWEQPYVMDCSRYISEFGAEATSIEHGLEACLSWYRAYFGLGLEPARR